MCKNWFLILIFLSFSSLAGIIDGTWQDEKTGFEYKFKKEGKFNSDALPQTLKDILTDGEFGWIQISSKGSVIYGKTAVYFLDENKVYAEVYTAVDSKKEDEIEAYSIYKKQANKQNFPVIFPIIVLSKMLLKDKQLTFIDEASGDTLLLNRVCNDTRPQFHVGFNIFVDAFVNYFKK